eukprot:361298-Karenia_brevis.AAC.1
MLAEQTRKFEQAAQQHERDARGIAEAEMMREMASSSHLKQSLDGAKASTPRLGKSLIDAENSSAQK